MKRYYNFGQNSVKAVLLLHVSSPTYCILIISTIKVRVYVWIIHKFISFRRHVIYHPLFSVESFFSPQIWL